jgi:hypothetical protein
VPRKDFSLMGITGMEICEYYTKGTMFYIQVAYGKDEVKVMMARL